MVKILKCDNPEEIRLKMKNIGVDPYGIDIMAPKASMMTLETDSFSSIGANILKQELLSLGADAAVSRASITGKAKKSPVFIFGTYAQLDRLTEKLKRQPFGLSEIGINIKKILANSSQQNFILKAGRYSLNLSKKTLIMGILNITPDSFSGDGLYNLNINLIVEYALKMIEDGADIIDVGGESTRPGAKPVSVEDEIKRVVPVIKALAKKIKIPVSIDTYKSEVARQALDNGASIVNDISGLRFDAKMPDVVSKQKAGLVIMHIKGRPRSMQVNPQYKNLINDIIKYLDDSISLALKSGVSSESIIIDPGIGFGKTLSDNLLILKKLKEFKSLGYPILVGVSRKSFIGRLLNVDVDKRSIGTIAASAYAILEGANIIRVHDIKPAAEMIKILNTIQNGH